jgi:hypothetical protein
LTHNGSGGVAVIHPFPFPAYRNYYLFGTSSATGRCHRVVRAEVEISRILQSSFYEDSFVTKVCNEGSGAISRSDVYRIGYIAVDGGKRHALFIVHPLLSHTRRLVPENVFHICFYAYERGLHQRKRRNEKNEEGDHHLYQAQPFFSGQLISVSVS